MLPLTKSRATIPYNTIQNSSNYTTINRNNIDDYKNNKLINIVKMMNVNTKLGISINHRTL